MRPERLAAVLCAFALSASLAGCTQGDPGDDGKFQGTCPQWVQGMSQQTVGLGAKFLYSNQTTQPDLDDWDFSEPTYDSSGRPQTPGSGFGDGLLEFQGHPLDRLVFDFRAEPDLSKTKTLLYVQDAVVRVRFFASDGGNVGEPMEAWDLAKGRGSSAHEWTFGTDPAKGYGVHNVTLQVDLADPAAEPDPHGVFVYWEWTFDLDHDRDTASSVVAGYSPQMWYRQCNADGTEV